MTNKIKEMLGFKPKTPTTDFSNFFQNASSGEKKKLILEVAKKANAEQKAVVEAYRKAGLAR